ncbi:hypothetical protein J7I80_21640 [Bacillus sp. ISL-41]|nr:hypothetical protein [Bacillus sp. ISL-41]MBT2644824.1 hypothetical protein [Bacillus sp. ISL-41]
MFKFIKSQKPEQLQTGLQEKAEKLSEAVATSEPLMEKNKRSCQTGSF